MQTIANPLLDIEGLSSLVECVVYALLQICYHHHSEEYVLFASLVPPSKGGGRVLIVLCHIIVLYTGVVEYNLRSVITQSSY